MQILAPLKSARADVIRAKLSQLSSPERLRDVFPTRYNRDMT